MKLTTVQLESPYLIFIGDTVNPLDAKTGLGVAHWAAGKCAGQMRLPQCAVDTGLPDLDVDAAVAAGVRTVIIGVAPVGGRATCASSPCRG